jgi:hypothetical protein
MHSNIVLVTGVFPVPGIQLHDRRASAYYSTLWCYVGEQNAIAAQDGRNPGVSIVGNN